MVGENELWNETPNIYVAFLDIMGFKDKVFREKHDIVLEMLESLYPAIESIEKVAKKRLEDQIQFKETKRKENTNPSSLFPISFSDSIILFSSDDSDDSANLVIIDTLYIMSEAIKNGIPMKGAIAFGEMTVNTKKSLFFGKPLIDAYELHKELLIYGVALHHTAQRQLNKMKEIIIRDLYVSDYPIPTKSGNINHNFLNWCFFNDHPVDLVVKLYDNVSGTPRIYVDNTLKFVIEIQKKQQQIIDKATQKAAIKKKD